MSRRTRDGLRKKAEDRGSYLLLLEMKKSKRIRIGRLGAIPFARGHYVYVGSAMRNLSGRIARHLRKRKKLRWHIDYLRRHADGVQALPIRSSMRQECEIAKALSSIMGHGPARFGSSDCHCPTHLFHHPSDPLQSRAFHDLLERFQNSRPSKPS